MKRLPIVIILILSYFQYQASPFSPQFMHEISPLTCTKPQSPSPKPSIALPNKEDIPSLLNKENAKKIINIGALAYAVAKLCVSYHHIYYKNISQPRWFSYLLPSGIETLKKRNLILWQTILITGETLFFKTLTECLLVCATLDFFSLVRSTTKNT